MLGGLMCITCVDAVKMTRVSRGRKPYLTDSACKRTKKEVNAQINES
jgi:hypothetical protein